MKNYKKLNRLHESVEAPMLSPEMQNCGLSEFMNKLEGCCTDNPELVSKVDSLKMLVSEICAQPNVAAAFAAVEPAQDMPAEPQDQPTPTEPELSEPVPTFGEFSQGQHDFNVPSFGA